MKQPPIDRERLADAYSKARAHLLSQRAPDGFWVGELASSSLSTATAVCALTLVDRQRFAALIGGGARWLLDHQADDGGWGDTVKSFSNISTTMLCRAALTLVKEMGATPSELLLTRTDKSLRRAEDYLNRVAGGRDPETLARAIRARYGKDRTFSVPILLCSALAGLIDWREAPPLPFELACLPASAYKWMNLPVVSYALPALIGLGILQHTKTKQRIPLGRQLRQAAIPRALRKLESIQPVNGGFLEATPLVSFVTMSLAGAGRSSHPVVQKAVQFLEGAASPDGSWPIDTNLSTWVTTLSINALMDAGDELLDSAGALRRWLLDQQYRATHPFTSAAPGGWGWTPLPGAVPDADDTSGALLALWNLGVTAESSGAAKAGVSWLLDLQNGDGGWPTFCRGWGHLPFDRSSADISAHALRALAAWKNDLQPASFATAGEMEAYTRRVDGAIKRGLRFLGRAQRSDGAWVPLWFGNQHAPDDENPTYGTTRVLTAYRALNLIETEAARRGLIWLIRAQGYDGGWGGAPHTPSSVEETALAVDALLGCGELAGSKEAIERGIRWLVERVEDGGFVDASPIGFYFAKLWYFEQLYPVIFITGALGRAVQITSTEWRA
ncbi:MAG TPA: prenyltransferase/squalene oxidase repeat-containing protein [Blastocatellia bacterium]|jgi:squalene-hopene/tetraprenyl-beta-curcumene cyclase|nr:prenyltransferase/squalene oxidase repeat-containing protein [Blastocatellia bacterium]